jgi:hypothetical protein
VDVDSAADAEHFLEHLSRGLRSRGRTETPSYLEPVPTRRGTLAWQLVVPDRRTYEKTVGDGTIVTLIRLTATPRLNPIRICGVMLRDSPRRARRR